MKKKSLPEKQKRKNKKHQNLEFKSIDVLETKLANKTQKTH